MVRRIGSNQGPRLRDLTGLDAFLLPRDARRATRGHPDADASRQRLSAAGLWPLSADDLAWLDEQAAAAAREQHDRDRRMGEVTDDCPLPAESCDVCGRPGETRREVAHWHADGTDQGVYCYSTCDQCDEAQRGPFYGGPAPDDVEARVDAHAEHMGWTD